MTEFETQTEVVRGKDSFEATHWSIVLSAATPTGPQAQAALGVLCRTYWQPLFVWVNRQGHSPADAQDLVQGFFAKLIEKGFLASADPEKGRFRSFLLLALKRYMANQRTYRNRKRRGGGKIILSLEEIQTEFMEEIPVKDGLSPEKAFDRQWALTLLQQVLNRLSTEFNARGKGHLFEEIKVLLNGDKGGSYAEIAERLEMSESAIKVSVHRLRQRYRELLRLEIAKTLASSELIDEEIQALFEALV